MRVLNILVAAALIAGASAGAAAAQQAPYPQSPNSGASYPQGQGPGAGGPAGPGGLAAAMPPPSPALRAARRNMRQTCAPDMARLCPDAHAGPGGGLGKCMMQHRAELSPSCRDAMVALRQARQSSR